MLNEVEQSGEKWSPNLMEFEEIKRIEEEVKRTKDAED